MISEWKSYLLNRADEWGLPTSGAWDVLFYNNYHPHISSMSVFWFHNTDRDPKVVTKIFHEPAIPTREFDNLRCVHDSFPGIGPTPFDLGKGNFFTLWMSGVPGLAVRKPSDCSLGELLSITATVADMHRAFQRDPAESADDRYSRLFLRPLESVSRFGPSQGVAEGCRRLTNTITPHWLETVPSIPQHGDLYLGHILSDNGRWHIVDWESFGLINLPFYDLCTLLISMLWDRGNTPAEWDTSLMQEAPHLVRSYAAKLGLEASDIARLLPLALMNWFHIQWSDGRLKFSERLYATLTHYFDNVQEWERIFVPR